MPSLSVVIITYNEECKIKKCIEAVTWADEIIVVDSFSTDRTREIAREYTDLVYQNAWEGFAKQRTYGMNQASGDWILFLDADEYVTDALQNKLKELLQDHSPFHAFKLHRVEHFLGFPLHYGTLNPSYQPRLLCKGKGYWTGGAHAHIEVADELMGLIHEDLFHDSHNTITDFITRINYYTTVDAQDRIQQGQRVGKTRLIFSPIGMAWKSFIVKHGYRDGFPGLLFSIGMGMYSFLRLVKVWQLNNEASSKNHHID